MDLDSPTAMQTSPMQMSAPSDGMAVSSYYSPDTATDIPGDLTGGLPINLDSLRDGPPGSKPFYPYSTLIRYAIKGSPTQKLLLEDIYYAIESRFPYFRTAPPGWKNSVRHNLSLNPCFEKVPRPLTDRGKGSYWTVNDNIDPRTGVHRVRKKRGLKAKRSSREPEQEDAYNPDESVAAATFETPSPVYEQPPQEIPAAAVQDLQVQAAAPSEPNGDFNQYMRPLPELDANGNVNWRSAWHNELTKLQHITAEQDKLQVEQEWYKEMLFRVRTAMCATIGPDGTLQVTPAALVPEGAVVAPVLQTTAETQEQQSQ